MRTVFLGTSEFAVIVLRRLAASAHRPALVVTRPDRRRGRGRRLAATPVAEAARELEIELDQPERINEQAARARIAAARPEVAIVCAFGAVIREPLLSAQPILNVHPSLLPRWRGAAPIERAIIAGDRETGVCVMRLTEGLDSGPVALRSSEPIGPQETYGSLAPRLAARGGELLVRVLDERPGFAPQEGDATYACKLEPADRRLDPGRPAIELERRVRALAPHVGALVEDPDGASLRVHAATPSPELVAPGELVARDGRLLWGCAGGALELLVVQPAGRRAMAAAAYLRGHPRS